MSTDYPNGSVPYGDAEETLALRAKRFACAAVNHHPRRYDGSWCCGFGYVCGRCQMYADQRPQAEIVRRIEALGPDADQMDITRAFGGGPSQRKP